MTLSAETSRRYRERLRQQGMTEVLLKLPHETLQVIDRFRDEHGASSRSDVVASLIYRALEAENTLKTA